MKRHLIYKLLAINLGVIVFAMIIIWIAIDILAAGYFVTLMEKYHISPKPAHAMFVDAVHRYMIWASVSALLLAVALSFVMTRKALSPLTKMNAISKEIGAGNFDVKVPVTSEDEVGQLARAFNGMAANLKKVEMLRKKLMVDVAHELRTPLTNIRGYLEALHDGVLPASAHNISLLQDEALRLNLLVEDVLALAHADAAIEQLKFERTDIVHLVETLTENVFSEKTGDNLPKWHIHADKSPIYLMADPKRMEQVIRNLARNAASYAPKGGQVDIRFDTSSQNVRISFINAAKDLNPEDIPFLFERFFRGEKSRSRDHGGAGIGLSIVKELVQTHGGNVGAQLEDEKIRIWFELPV